MKRVWKTNNGTSIVVADRRIYTGVPLYEFGYQACNNFDTRKDLSGIREREQSCMKCLSHLESELGRFMDNPEYSSILDLGPVYDCWRASAEFASSSPEEAVRILREKAQFMSKEEIPDKGMLGKIFGKVREGKYVIVFYTQNMKEAYRLGKEIDRVFREEHKQNGYKGYLLGCGCEDILMPLVGPSDTWEDRRTPIIDADSEKIKEAFIKIYNYLHV